MFCRRSVSLFHSLLNCSCTPWYNFVPEKDKNNNFPGVGRREFQLSQRNLLHSDGIVGSLDKSMYTIM